MHIRGIDVVGVSYNLAARLLIDDDGALCEITNMYGEDGFEVDDPDLALAVVAKRPDGKWRAMLVNCEGDAPVSPA